MLLIDTHKIQGRIGGISPNQMQSLPLVLVQFQLMGMTAVLLEFREA